ncbi:uncharacterized protein LY89DRAFT_776372 [Mollisia scopiformis]|uniref:Uncharacterized protein n=1 Tax=Mollisia scopiformis TaxID=149040 RepID=A0A194XVG5_MOLSC|nr:uncharacterized protein LY89DRAFT_776372 [Mollisia scopiformis]KUJ24218.1 hypothetical protein LY89DRAFT_776372 [Mollisia scopiformis]
MLVQNILLCIAALGASPLAMAAPLAIPDNEIAPRNALLPTLPIVAPVLTEERDVQFKRDDDDDHDGDDDDDDDDKNKDKGKGHGGGYNGYRGKPGKGGKGGQGGEGGKHYKRDDVLEADDTADVAAEGDDDMVKTNGEWYGHGGHGGGWGGWSGKHWRREDKDEADVGVNEAVRGYGKHGHGGYGGGYGYGKRGHHYG